MTVGCTVECTVYTTNHQSQSILWQPRTFPIRHVTNSLPAPQWEDWIAGELEEDITSIGLSEILGTDCLIINTSLAPQSSPGGHMDWRRQSPASWRTVLLLPPVPPVSTTSTLHTTSWTDRQNCGGINSSFNSLVLTGERLRLARDLCSVYLVLFIVEFRIRCNTKYWVIWKLDNYYVLSLWRQIRSLLYARRNYTSGS